MVSDFQTKIYEGAHMSTDYSNYTDMARAVMASANAIALEWNHDAVGTEHLLLGILSNEACGAAVVLKGLGFDIGKIRDKTISLMRKGYEAVPMGKLPYSTVVVEVSIRAVAEQLTILRHPKLGTEHLLLSLMWVGKGLAGTVLQEIDLNPNTLRDKVRKNGSSLDTVQKSTPDPSPGLTDAFQLTVGQVDYPAQRKKASDLLDSIPADALVTPEQKIAAANGYAMLALADAIHNLVVDSEKIQLTFSSSS